MPLPGLAEPASVFLLKSRKTTGSGGAGQPLNDVELLVFSTNKLVFSYVKVHAPENNTDRFFMDEVLELRSVTGHSIPEILFHSGTQGASDSSAVEHILHYDTSNGSFIDITPKLFYNSGTHALRWLTLRTEVLAVVADRNWSHKVPDELRCHYCPSPFLYRVYLWNERTKSFLVYRRIYGKHAYEEASQALTGDWQLIKSRLAGA